MGDFMKKGISIWAFTDRNPKVCFSLAKKYGFDGVEVGLGKEGPLRYDSTEEEIKEYKKAAEGYGLSFYSLVCDDCWLYPLTSDSAEIRQKGADIVKKQLETAALLGCDTTLVLPGMVQGLSPDSEVVPYDIAYDRALTEMRKLAKEAEGYNVTLGVENVWNKFLLSPLEMRDFIDRVGSPRVGAYFDVGNVVINGFPEQWIKILGNRIAKVHFKDFKRSIGTADGFVNILDGDVDYKAVMQELKNIGYNGWATAEVFSENTEEILAVNSAAMDKIFKM